MARSARALTRILPALLLMLDAAPSLAATETRSATRRGAIAACVQTGDMAVPVHRTVPDEPRGTDPADFAEMVAPLRHVSVVRVADTAHVRPPSPERTWLQLHRRRSPSPDDPDPY